MHERKSETPELTGQQLAVEQARVKAYTGCFQLFAYEAKAQSIEFEDNGSLIDSSRSLDLEFGYSSSLYSPELSRISDNIHIRIGIALRYLAIVFDNIQKGIDPAKLQPSMLNLDSVTIDGVYFAYETRFKRHPQDEKSSISRGIELGKNILFNTIMGENDKEELEKLRCIYSLTDIAAQTRIKGIRWGESKSEDGACSWLLIVPQRLP